MTLTPDEAPGEGYDEPRGLCPRCRNSAVTHLLFGMPSGPDAFEGMPFWVTHLGCVVVEFDRLCANCDYRWNDEGARRVKEDVARRVVSKVRGIPADGFDAWPAPEGCWFLQEVAPYEIPIDDSVWVVTPSGAVARAIPPGNPIHEPTDLRSLDG